MQKFAKIVAVLLLIAAAAAFITPFILYFAIIAGTLAAVFKHDKRTR